MKVELNLYLAIFLLVLYLILFIYTCIRYQKLKNKENMLKCILNNILLGKIEEIKVIRDDKQRDNK